MTYSQQTDKPQNKSQKMSGAHITGHIAGQGREIVFDTETTGLYPAGDDPDRITEIGCIEIIDFMPTGREFHAFLCPGDKKVSAKAVEITGLTDEFLADKPSFKQCADEFLDFIGDSPLIAHNASFDRGFVNAELARAGYEKIPTDRFIDTLRIARAKFPGSPASLDALCKRFDISLADRDKHGAIIDSQLLAAVYLDLHGGRAHKLDIFDEAQAQDFKLDRPPARSRPKPLGSLCSADELAAHEGFIAELGDKAIWKKYQPRKI